MIGRRVLLYLMFALLVASGDRRVPRAAHAARASAVAGGARVHGDARRRHRARRAGDAGWRGIQVLDRRGEPLNATFTNGWNVHDAVPLHEIPPFLRTAFVTAEDKRFFEHHGPDWSARLSAVWTNVKSGRAVRGASTISEQVVGMLHPRPRSVWSRWLEGFEARELERRFTKNEILEFYLNQVPYAANRRGVRQAASYYFARDLATLSKKEMLALAVLVRAPTRFDLKRDSAASAGAIERLAAALTQRGELSLAERDAVLAEPLAARRAAARGGRAAFRGACARRVARDGGRRTRRSSRRRSTPACKRKCSACSTSA